VLFLLVSGFLAGCGDSQDPAAWLADCGRKVDICAGEAGYVHFVQEMEYRMGMAQGDFEQILRVEGDIIFPDRESYQYNETVSSTLKPEQPQENSFSYLTLDGGATAYVMGERLSAELGVAGWIHYTPTPEQNRFFDYPELMAGLITMNREAEWLGFEDSGGERCAHVRYSASGQDLIDLRIQQDPSFEEQIQGLDADEIMGDLTVDIWMGEADKLPRRVSMEQVSSPQDGTSSATHLTFVFSAYGEEPPLLIEAPAFSREAV
jgi:hypothetical protein